MAEIRKRQNMKLKNILDKFLFTRWFTNGIQSLLKRADAISRGSADIIYCI